MPSVLYFKVKLVTNLLLLITFYAVVNLLVSATADFQFCDPFGSGGLKWTRTIGVVMRFASLSQKRSFHFSFVPRNLSDPFGSGGLKWTRTIDLTLIRRVL